MATPGRRFHISLDDKPGDLSTSNADLPAGINIGLVGDIVERVAASGPEAPSSPKLKSSHNGFPAHKIRTGSSRFKRGQESRSSVKIQSNKPEGPNDSNVTAIDTVQNDASHGTKDPSVDRENRQRLAQMSDLEIEEAKQELMAGLNPSLIEKLLKKANIDDDAAEAKAEKIALEDESPPMEPSSKEVTFEDCPNAQNHSLSWDPDGPPLHIPPDLHPASSHPSSLPQPPNIHFPEPRQPPDLDPSDPDFLSALHSTYFPNLPADPSTMAWMTPLDPKSEEDSVYSPSKAALHVSAIRFNFRGQLLPPRLSSQIPSTKGLHHHAHAPSSAGYTVPELAHLARSSYPAQRCIAYQTLGRILYRLGRGDFGREGEDLCEGLWQQMEQGRVIDQLVEAAAKGDAGNKSIWVTATEAVWLWRKGGGRRWKGR